MRFLTSCLLVALSQPVFAAYLKVTVNGNIRFQNIITQVRYIDAWSDQAQNWYPVNVCSWGNGRGQRACCSVIVHSQDAAISLLRTLSAPSESTILTCVTSQEIENIAFFHPESFIGPSG